MNNREAFELLRDTIDDLTLVITDHGINSDPSYTFRNLVKYRKAFKKLNDAGLIGITIGDEVPKKISPILEGSDDNKPYPFSPGYSIRQGIVEIYSVLNSLYIFLGNQLSDENPSTINVKIRKIEDLEDLEKIANTLKKSFSLPVFSLGGHVTVDGLENGSAWIILGVKDTAGSAIKMCASLIWAAAVIVNKRDEASRIKKYNREIKIPNNIAQQIEAIQDTYINDSVDSEVELISREYLSNSDAEELRRIKLAIESIGELLNRGVEFHPSITAPEEVTKLFPSTDMIRMIESRTLMIEGEK